MRNRRLLLLLCLALLSLDQYAAAKSAPHKRPAAQKPQSDVVVTKNADGSVEVSDTAGGGGAGGGGDNGAAQTTGGGGITYKVAPPGTIRYPDGTVVRRNPDGSVDVMDEDTIHPQMHSLGSAPVSTHRRVTRSGGSKPHAKPAPAKKTK